MTTPLVYPLINGFKHSFASIELKLADDKYIGFKSINYESKLDRAKVYGCHPDPIAKTRGVADYSGDLEIYLAEWNQLQAKLGPGWADVSFTGVVSYIENGFDVIVDSLIGCTLSSLGGSNSQGTDATVKKVALDVMKILHNGVDMLSIPLKGVAQ